MKERERGKGRKERMKEDVPSQVFASCLGTNVEPLHLTCTRGGTWVSVRRVEEEGGGRREKGGGRREEGEENILSNGRSATQPTGASSSQAKKIQPRGGAYFPGKSMSSFVTSWNERSTPRPKR